MRPFSFTEKNTITELLRDIGYRNSLVPDITERYSIIDDTTICLTTKYPISIGLKLNIPFEVVSFNNSFIFQPRVINSQTLEMINFLATNLQYINSKLNLEHKFPIEEKKQEFLHILNNFMPEYFSGETDRQWLTRVRVASMNKYKIFKNVENDFHDKLAMALNTVGLEPTWNLPKTLSEGIPKLKKDGVLFYSNPEGNEFFIVEKGFITFLRDFEHNNIHLRTFFESYSPLLLESTFGDISDFSVSDLILSWIRFSRMSLNPLINVLNSDYILSREFYQLNLNTFFNNNANLADTAIPIPILARERLTKEELFKPNYKLLNKPPSTFNELDAANLYEEAGRLFKLGKIESAAAVLADSLKIFNKYKQRVGTIKVLIKLSDMAMDMRKFDEATNYLKTALEICKTGEVSMEVIINIHEKLGNLYDKNRKYNLAIDHYKIITNFLKAQDPEKYHRAIQVVRLKIAKVLIQMEEYKDANLVLKTVAKESEKYPDVLAIYYLEKAKYLMKREQVSNAIQLLKKGAVIEDAKKNTLALIHYELGRIYIYDRNIGSKAQAHLLAADKLLGEEKSEDLFMKIKIYESLADAFNKTKDREEMNYYIDRSRQIRKLLQVRGLY